jgi:hypothetical protein
MVMKFSKNEKKEASDKTVRCVCGFLQIFGKIYVRDSGITPFMGNPINHVILFFYKKEYHL